MISLWYIFKNYFCGFWGNVYEQMYSSIEGSIVMINRIHYALIIVFFAFNGIMHSAESWNWVYKKIFSDQEHKTLNNQRNLLYSKVNTPQFSQLIFSWNGFKPEYGYFTFWGQIRDSVTKKWHDWHKMIEWGCTLQRSFFTRAETGTICHHVRIEMPYYCLADGLRIKVEAHEGASLATLHGLFVSIANLNSCITEYSMKPHLPSVCITNIPLQSQMQLDHPKKEVLCSPTSCSMIISYFTGGITNPVDIAQSVYDNGLNAYGSWPFNTAQIFQSCNGAMICYVTRLHSFSNIHELLQQGIPVVVSVRGKLRGAPHDYNQGHLLVVIGWDARGRKVICHDPAFETNEKVHVRYDLDAFLEAWERSHHLTYRVEYK